MQFWDIGCQRYLLTFQDHCVIVALYCQAFTVRDGCVIKGEEAQHGSVVSETLVYPSILWDQIL